MQTKSGIKDLMLHLLSKKLAVVCSLSGLRQQLTSYSFDLERQI